MNVLNVVAAEKYMRRKYVKPFNQLIKRWCKKQELIRKVTEK